MTLTSVTISSADGSTTATFAPDANMVCSSLRVDGEERLAQRTGVDAYAAHGSTMGIPLLYPWANRLAAHSYEAAGRRVQLPVDPARVHQEANGLPIHGLAPSLMRWGAVEAGESAIAAALDWDDAGLRELFPYEHRIELEAQLSAQTLSVTATVTATGEDRVPVSFGFHPYLLLHGAGRDEWKLELPPCRRLQLDDRKLPTGERLPLAPEPIPLRERNLDDAYELDVPGGAEFVARAGARRIAVTLHEGFAYAQVYSPPGAEFVCFEPMCAPGNALRSGDGLRVLEPGDSHRASFTIALAG